MKSIIDKNVLIITEANEKVASGHLFECRVLYEELKKQGVVVHLVVNSDMQELLKRDLPDDTLYYDSNIQEETEKLVDYCFELGNIDILLFNLRDIRNDTITKIRLGLSQNNDELMSVNRDEGNDCGILPKIVCIDEFGHKVLDSDVIINPMIDDYFWKYDKTENQLKTYCGMEYLILPKMLTRYHNLEKRISKDINIITISMGGVDIFGTTLKVVEWLMEEYSTITLNVVLGGGFKYRSDLEKIIEHKKSFGLENKKKQTTTKVNIYQNINFIYDLFYESDIAICAGGNTLHELAAIGTPAIIIPTMPHENRNGKCFVMNEFGILSEMAEKITKKEFMEAYKALEKEEVRMQMCRCGKNISDGNGCYRVIGVLDNVISRA